MINNLPSNKWSVISAVGAVVALLVPFLLYIIGHESKDLSVATVSRAVLVNLSQGEGGSITLTYNGTPVSHLMATTIEVRNDGTKPIERSDFERPLLIKFPKNSSILAATLGEKAPGDLQPVITLESGAITIAPLLLNPGDRFRVTAQLLGDFDEPAVEARISGIRAVSRQAFRDSGVKSPLVTGIIGVLGLFVYFYFSWFVWMSFSREPHVILLPFADGLFVTLFLCFASAMSVALTFRALNWNLAQGKIVTLIFIPVAAVLSVGLARARRKVTLARFSEPPHKDSTV